jgi:indolepyruvate ferredoxin oxidoreductase beta subunit
MNTINMVLCGLGGQGILFMTNVLAQAALRKGYDVLGAETHGMAQRGGSVVSHLRLGNVQGSLVETGTAQALLALEENEAYRNLPFLAPGGRLFVNTSSSAFPREEVRGYLVEKEIMCRGVPATSIAVAMGVALSSNLALLGYFSVFAEGPFNHDELRETIGEVSPDRFRENNLKVFDAGFERAMEEKGD